MRRIFVILIFIVNVFAFANAHPVHISVVNMDIAEDGSIIFSVKLFTDDFEHIINAKNNSNISFNKNTELSSIEKYVTKYISDNFKIQTNTLSYVAHYKLTKMTFNKEAVWFYFEVEDKKHNFDNLIVENSLMCDLFQDQTNLFIINMVNTEEAFSFNNKKQTRSFICKP